MRSYAPEPTWAIVILVGELFSYDCSLSQAAYLSREGKRVAVLERRHVLGGAAVTEEIVPGVHLILCMTNVCTLLLPCRVQVLQSILPA